MPPRTVFVTGGTGYLGARLIAALIERGHEVHALARARSAGRLPVGCRPVVGDVLAEAAWAPAVPRGATFVHLVGVAHPAPWKGREFERIDLGSVCAAVAAALGAGARQFVYVSVAQPAPVMRAYVAVRTRCENAVRASGLPATFLRPWYVLGPDRRWPLALAPLYAVARRLPATREAAARLGLLRLPEMLAALVWAVENPPDGEPVRVLTVPQIRALAA